jgi:uncharacterized protein YdhG (YjbR/CyaY superfamily)
MVKASNIDEYIASQPKTTQAVLQSVRSTIRKALPAAEETISDNIPAFKLGGSPILWFAGWKKHYSLYPAGERLVTAFQPDLVAYEITKGTIRFPLSEPVPIKLIERIAAFRAQEAIEKEKAKVAAKKAKVPRSSSGRAPQK